MTQAVSRLDRITVDPAICHGAPTIRGMRLRVQDVLEARHIKDYEGGTTTWHAS